MSTSRKRPALQAVRSSEPPMSERRQKRSGEILAAAREVFLERGFERTAISEVAARVGIVEGLVFSYFPTKRDLLHEVLREMYEPLIQDMADGYARLRGLRARLRFIVWRHVRVYAETPGLARLVLHEVRTGPEYDTSGLHALQVRYTQYVRLALEAAVADGELPRPVDAEMVRSLLYGGLEHLLWPVLHGRQAVDVETVAERFTDMLLQGLLQTQQHDSVESRLARLESLLAAPAARRPARKTRAPK